MISLRAVVASFVCSILLVSFDAMAEDWPEFKGAGRTGVWSDTGILEKFPEDGLSLRWSVPIHAGYAGPAVAEGRVFVTDFETIEGNRGTERAICLDEKTGEILWTRAWDADYHGLSYNYGTRATPTVDGDRVYVLGAMGELEFLDAATGEVLWRKHYVADLGAALPMWGFSGAPLVVGDLLICLAGVQPDGMVVAFDKASGEERWRAISYQGAPGYVQPILIEAAGVQQVIVWHSQAVTSLNPATGEVYWEVPFKIKMDGPLAVPIHEGSSLFVSAFYNGPLMLDLAGDAPGVKIRWKGTSNSEINTDGLHAVFAAPVLKDGHLYGICSYGQFRCLDAATGERVWMSLDVTKENRRWASAFIVRNGDRYFMNNDRGELIIADLQPDGYREIDRTHLIDPTTRGGGRRDLNFVNWTHPAYANGHIFTRNDEMILSASLLK